MSHTKAGGSTRNGRDSASKRLGVKRFGGETVQTGDIIVRQRGSKYVAGTNIVAGKDHTLHAKTDGTVAFAVVRKKAFSGLGTRKTVVSVK